MKGEGTRMRVRLEGVSRRWATRDRVAGAPTDNLLDLDKGKLEPADVRPLDSLLTLSCSSTAAYYNYTICNPGHKLRASIMSSGVCPCVQFL